MAGTTLDQLPLALSLSGTELVWLYQQGPDEVTPWIGVRCTTFQLAALATGAETALTCSMRQLFTALADNNLMVTAFEALPADITNSNNIAWNHAFRMTITDSFITGFLQPAISYDDAQMAALFVQALSFPV